MSKSKKVFIVEGYKYEPSVIKHLNTGLKLFKNIEIVVLPAGTNIYSIYESLSLDDGVDIVEIIKELLSNNPSKVAKQAIKKYENLKRADVSEVYLFYDYDGHVNNLLQGVDVNDYLNNVIDFFDNETEQGKIYISYPMAEALQWFSSHEICKTNCFYCYQNGAKFKKDLNSNKMTNRIDGFTMDDISFSINQYLAKIACLNEAKSTYTTEQAKKYSSSKIIFENQLVRFIAPKSQVMILSAFPQFLVEYFNEETLCSMFTSKGSSKLSTICCHGDLNSDD